MRHRLILAALAAGGSLALLAGTATAASAPWTVVPSVNPSATTLNAVFARTAQASVAVRAKTALRVVVDGLTLGTTVQVGVAAMAVPASRASEPPAPRAAAISRCRMLVPP